ncbi:MAG: hypothetical protein M1608_00610 [Candidatus Omnitrophica bacterium]|nr:hypothetical protein [Candidatus Omnitrophota bacterium]
MQTRHSGIIETAKDGNVAGIKGTGELVQVTVNAVTKVLATTIKKTGKAGTAVTKSAPGGKVTQKEPAVAASWINFTGGPLLAGAGAYQPAVDLNKAQGKICH